ncbi:hypothetical protein J6590_039085 [Homalodisca vitripennis]|nr:hypothetical protein J6590_039085 [Homalodisca vitripennis]
MFDLRRLVLAFYSIRCTGDRTKVDAPTGSGYSDRFQSYYRKYKRFSTEEYSIPVVYFGWNRILFIYFVNGLVEERGLECKGVGVSIFLTFSSSCGDHTTVAPTTLGVINVVAYRGPQKIIEK